jgi:hypothetical protein
MLQWKLRDLFWLAMVCACATLWVLGHRETAKEIAANEPEHSLVTSWQAQPVPTDAIQRHETTQELVKWSNQELSQRLRERPDSRQFWEELCLAEMGQRGMKSELASYHESCKMQDGHRTLGQRGQRAKSLIALRRAERAPDPLRVSVGRIFVNDSDVGSRGGSTLVVQVENVDPDKTAIIWSSRSDHNAVEHWHVELRDSQGQLVSGVNTRWNFRRISHGWNSYQEVLPANLLTKREKAYVWLNIHQHVAPPPSGRYRLQLFYHSERCIAGEEDFSGLILLKSEPIEVWVDNLDQARFRKRRLGPGFAAVLAIGMVALPSLLWWGRRKSPWKGLSRRDCIWCGLVLLLAAVWWLDLTAQAKSFQETQYHPDARWTVRPIIEE